MILGIATNGFFWTQVLNTLSLPHTNRITAEKGEDAAPTKEFPVDTYKGVPLRLSADFSKETLQARRDWQEVFKVMKSRDLQPRLLYPANLSFRIKEQIKCF